MFHASVMDRKFQDLREFQGCFKEVLMMIQGKFRKFQGVTKSFRCGSLRGMLEAFQGFLKKLSRVFQECFKGARSNLRSSLSKKLSKCIEILKVCQRISEMF